MIDVWTWLNGNAAGVSALAAVFTAIIAIIAIRSSAADSRRRSRPYVIVSLLADPHTKAGVMNLVVENIGQSAARDVEVTFEPALPIPENKTGSLIWYVIQRYQAPVPLLAPNQSLTNAWRLRDSAEDKHGPRTVSVRVKYKGNRRRRYADVFKLDAATVEFAAGVMLPSERSSLNRIADFLVNGR
ncbi:hypothetical protein BH09ACT5_BH09ACT5_05960 [soil metagenome]